MKIKILEKEITYPNETSVSTIFTEIDTELANSGYFFSHVIIDGFEIYEDIERHIQLNRDKIEYIDVQVRTVREFSTDLLLTIREYIQGAKPALNSLINELYSASGAKSWESLTQLIEGLQWVHEAMHTIDQSSYHPINWQEYRDIISNMSENIMELSEGVQNKDTILIGDIIQYEIIPRLEELAQEVEVTLKNEGIHYDTN